MDDDHIIDLVAVLAEERIRQALKRGEFDNLPGQGKPLELEDLSHVPEELRAGYRVLKNARLLPQEVELRREIAKLQEALERSIDDEEKQPLKKRLLEKELNYNVLMENRRRRK